MNSQKYKRILLKLTGEILGGEEKKGIDFAAIEKVAKSIENLRKNLDIQLAIVVGAGNLFRARQVEEIGIDRVVADHIGMLGTIMNGLALQERLEWAGNNTRLMSSIEVNPVCEPYINRRAMRHLDKGRIVILAGGTGNPYFTTDSAAALRACELKCDVILKASNVDGIYEKDPRKFPKAKMLDKIDYQFALEKGINVMDNTAFALCQREKMPIIVFNIDNPLNIEKIIKGEKIGTLVTGS